MVNHLEPTKEVNQPGVQQDWILEYPSTPLRAGRLENFGKV